jgi:hypothetical protein
MRPVGPECIAVHPRAAGLLSNLLSPWRAVQDVHATPV